jgi:hypothetical protein
MTERALEVTNVTHLYIKGEGKVWNAQPSIEVGSCTERRSFALNESSCVSGLSDSNSETEARSKENSGILYGALE